MESLPVSVVVHIFSFLTVKDKCRSARVCKAWYHLVREKPLWRDVDLSPYRVSLQAIWKLARCYFTEALHSLHLRGFLHSVKKTECISSAALSGLGERCPRLAEFRIREANLTNVDSSNLPATLEVLEICGCSTGPGWLGPAVKAGRLANLETLNLSDSTRVCDQDLKDLAALPQGGRLKTLILRRCYRPSHEGFKALAEHLTNLRRLDLDLTNFGDEDMHFVGRHLKGLESLSLQGCRCLTELFLGPLATLGALQTLNLRGLRISGDQLADLLAKLSNLKYLDVSESDVMSEADFDKQVTRANIRGRISSAQQT